MCSEMKKARITQGDTGFYDGVKTSEIESGGS